MAQDWLRLYRSAVNNPKVQRLGLEAVGFWVNCLCVSDDNGRLPSVADMAWAMRLTETVTETFLKRLHETGLVDKDGRTYRLHDWDEHQFRSDTSTPRVKRFRQKQRETQRNVSETAPEQRQSIAELEPDSEHNRDSEPSLGAVGPRKGAAAAKGTRWPSDAVVPEDWIEAGAAARAEHKLPPIDLSLEAVRFQNHWSEKTGKDATKVAWKRTWITWAISPYAGARNGRANGSGRNGDHPLGVFGALIERERAKVGEDPDA